MSIRVASSSLIAGAVVVGDPGHGVLAELIPSTGEHGPAYTFDSLEFPADNGKEIRGLITTWPTLGTLTAFEDTSFEYDGLSDTFAFQLYVDGAAVGTPQTVTVTIGVSAITASGAVSEAYDAASGSAALVWPSLSASGASTESTDAAAGAAALIWPTLSASGAVTESADESAGTATVAWPAITSSVAVTEAADAAAGTVVVGDVRLVSGAISEASDAAAGAATLIWPAITASAAITERRDVAQGAIVVPLVTLTASGVVVERADTVAGNASSFSAITATAAIIERGDTVAGRIGGDVDRLPVDAYIAAYLNGSARGGSKGDDYLRLGERFARKRGLI